MFFCFPYIEVSDTWKVKVSILEFLRQSFSPLKSRKSFFILDKPNYWGTGVALFWCQSLWGIHQRKNITPENITWYLKQKDHNQYFSSVFLFFMVYNTVKVLTLLGRKAFGKKSCKRKKEMLLTSIFHFLTVLYPFKQKIQYLFSSHIYCFLMLSVWAPPWWLRGVSNSLPGVCVFDPWLRGTFSPAYFFLSPLQRHVRKVVGGFEKEKLC